MGATGMGRCRLPRETTGWGGVGWSGGKGSEECVLCFVARWNMSVGGQAGLHSRRQQQGRWRKKKKD